MKCKFFLFLPLFFFFFFIIIILIVIGNNRKICNSYSAALAPAPPVAAAAAAAALEIVAQLKTIELNKQQYVDRIREKKNQIKFYSILHSISVANSV